MKVHFSGATTIHRSSLTTPLVTKINKLFNEEVSRVRESKTERFDIATNGPDFFEEKYNKRGRDFIDLMILPESDHVTLQIKRNPELEQDFLNILEDKKLAYIHSGSRYDNESCVRVLGLHRRLAEAFAKDTGSPIN